MKMLWYMKKSPRFKQNEILLLLQRATTPETKLQWIRMQEHLVDKEE